MATLTPAVGATRLTSLELGTADGVPTARINSDGTIETTAPIDAFGNNVIRLTTADSISTAIAAASAGDVIELAAGTYTHTTALTVSKALTIRGQGKGVTTIAMNTGSIASVLSLTAACTIENLTVYTNTATGLTGVTASAAATVRNCAITMVGAGSKIGVSCSGNVTLTVEDCDISCSSTSDRPYGIRPTPTASTTPTITASRCNVTVVNTMASGGSTVQAAYCAAVEWSSAGAFTGTINAYDCRMSSTADLTTTARIFVAHNSSSSGSSTCNINAYNCHSVIPSGDSGAHVYSNGQGSGRTATVAIYACDCDVPFMQWGDPTPTSYGIIRNYSTLTAEAIRFGTNENLGVIMGAGADGYEFSNGAADANLIEFRTKTTVTSGSSRLAYLRHHLTGNGAVSGDALRPFLVVKATGITAAQGVHVTTQIDSAKSVTGLGVGLRSSLTVNSTVAQGSLYAIMADMQGTGAQTNTKKAFVLFRDAHATTKTDTLFQLGDAEGELGTGTDGAALITTGGTAGAFAGKALAVNIGGVRYYINLFAVPTT